MYLLVAETDELARANGLDVLGENRLQQRVDVLVHALDQQRHAEGYAQLQLG